MSRPCSICVSSDRAAIEREIGVKLPYAAITDRYGVSRSAIIRHKRDHMQAGAEASGSGLPQCVEGLSKLVEACDRRLRDPLQGDRYELATSAGELAPEAELLVKASDIIVRAQELIRTPIITRSAEAQGALGL